MHEAEVNAPAQGLGDVVAKITHATGIDKVADQIAKIAGKDDCGCNQRREALNRLFPFKRAESGSGVGKNGLPEATSAEGQPYRLTHEEMQAGKVPEGIQPPMIPAPSPLQVLLGLVNDPETVERVYAWAKGVHPPFPVAASPLVLCRFLFLAGIAIPYGGTIDRQIGILRQYHTQFLPATETPQAGDMFVTARAGEYERLGLVVEVAEDGTFLVADNVMPDYRPYRRTVGGEEHAPVLFWLRATQRPPQGG